ncbi:hypothetical protein HMPREF0294_2203 [Corynebacterium glucuronolyticum ATCC 51867]|nr:hypothetical protein HMPREF0294_2203 [Corynebacterium glucuronolyticum ATCC 51867]
MRRLVMGAGPFLVSAGEESAFYDPGASKTSRIPSLTVHSSL